MYRPSRACIKLVKMTLSFKSSTGDFQFTIIVKIDDLRVKRDEDKMMKGSCLNVDDNTSMSTRVG